MGMSRLLGAVARRPAGEPIEERTGGIEGHARRAGARWSAGGDDIDDAEHVAMGVVPDDGGTRYWSCRRRW